MVAEGLETFLSGLFSKALQALRMIERGETDRLSVPVAEAAALGRRLERFVTREEMAAAEEGLAEQRWEKPTLELSVGEGYRKWAEEYDREANPLIAIEEPAVWELVGDAAGKEALDAACGTGRYAVRLAQEGARVRGVDASEDMLAVARRKRDELGVRVELGRGDLTALPFPEESFDVAICALALCHLPDLRGPMRELARVLRPGGRLIVSDFHPFALLIGWRTAFRRAEATYLIENHSHLIADYVGAARESGLRLGELREEVVDERLATIVSELDVMRFRGFPLALIMAAEKEGS